MDFIDSSCFITKQTSIFNIKIFNILDPSFCIFYISGDLNWYLCLFSSGNQIDDFAFVFAFIFIIERSHFNVGIVFRWSGFIMNLDSGSFVWIISATLIKQTSFKNGILNNENNFVTLCGATLGSILVTKFPVLSGDWCWTNHTSKGWWKWKSWRFHDKCPESNNISANSVNY